MTTFELILCIIGIAQLVSIGFRVIDRIEWRT